MNTKRKLTCCCCGGDAGTFEQHWNRDTGFGICRQCLENQVSKEPADQIKSYYGIEGVNYATPKDYLIQILADACRRANFILLHGQSEIAIRNQAASAILLGVTAELDRRAKQLNHSDSEPGLENNSPSATKPS